MIPHEAVPVQKPIEAALNHPSARQDLGAPAVLQLTHHIDSEVQEGGVFGMSA